MRGASGGSRRGRVPVCCLLLMVCCAVPALAWMDTEGDILEMGYNPNGIFILDGTYVMNVGEVQINITNWGLIGSGYLQCPTLVRRALVPVAGRLRQRVPLGRRPLGRRRGAGRATGLHRR